MIFLNSGCVSALAIESLDSQRSRLPHIFADFKIEVRHLIGKGYSDKLEKRHIFSSDIWGLLG